MIIPCVPTYLVLIGRPISLKALAVNSMPLWVSYTVDLSPFLLIHNSPNHDQTKQPSSTYSTFGIKPHKAGSFLSERAPSSLPMNGICGS